VKDAYKREKSGDKKTFASEKKRGEKVLRKKKM
jgi:hypothetical protein